MTHRLTSTQPGPVRQKIYGSVPNRPLGGPSDQPEALPHTKVYGQKRIPTVRVRLKGSADDRELVISEDDFNPDLHELVDA